MIISDFFHLQLGASVGGDQQHSYGLKVFIVFVALGLPFPWVHVGGGGGGGGGGSTGFQFKYQTQAVEFPQVLASRHKFSQQAPLHQ